MKLIVHGAAGRMGREIVNAATTAPGFEIAAALGRTGSASLGADVGVLAGAGALGVVVSDDVAAGLAAGDVAIDVSQPAAAVRFARQASAAGKPVVVATTGLNAEQLASVREGAGQAPVLIAANLSLGINVLAQILPTIARALGAEYDVEVVEAHHRHKKDAPSGTAIRLLEAITAALGRSPGEVSRHGRSGLAPRQPGEIGVHSLRAGGIVGEHSVFFVSEGEQIEVAHRAFSRRTFALGGLRAAAFLADQRPGLYTMQDVLG
ncbi:MAG: 4-hydroxy-tetrahydrodipicolinate reductase [Chloroflexota bacterium]